MLAAVLGQVPQALLDGLVYGFVYALVAAGLALIWGVADVVNFAHGEYLLVSMFVAYVAAAQFGLDPLVVLPVNVVLLFVLGYLTHVLVVSKVMDGSALSQILATFSLVLVGRFGMLFLAGPGTRSVEAFAFSGYARVGGLVVSFPAALTAAASAVTLAGLFVFLRRTAAGTAIRATAQDREAARAVGVDTDRAYALAWGVGIGVTGVAGTLLVTFVPLQPELTPTVWTMFSFAAVALGGFGSVAGAVVGGVVIGLVEHLGVALLDPSFRELYVFVVFLGALVLRPEGLVNRR